MRCFIAGHGKASCFVRQIADESSVNAAATRSGRGASVAI